ncbi:MAG: DUF5069 domain-containing protein [Verrucomicrobiales bacterium]|nr:DUF5069 domain-containing protein [Verrucomicrobiales bacterium]
MSQIIPMISSGTAGPLGVLHLPRVWLKASLHATGKIHPDYTVGCGYDKLTTDNLGIAWDDFYGFIKEQRPTYAQCEAWVKAYPGVKLSAADRYRHNQAILGYIHDDDTRKEILNACGRADDGSCNPGAVDLNNLDDWQIFHQQELK